LATNDFLKGSGSGLQPFVPLLSSPDGTPLPTLTGGEGEDSFMGYLTKFLSRFYRSPDVVIGSKEDPYLLRWYVIPRNRFFNIYLHKFLRDDDDRALHDHPWANCSFILSGGYWEHQPGGLVRKRTPFRFYFRRATQAHRIELFYEDMLLATGEITGVSQACWSLFITGPKVREWGFHCPKGWVHWKIFCSAQDTNEVEYGLIGRGCE
jgi:hypothetical protein